MNKFRDDNSYSYAAFRGHLRLPRMRHFLYNRSILSHTGVITMTKQIKLNPLAAKELRKVDERLMS